jgi:hypothetical protein
VTDFFAALGGFGGAGGSFSASHCAAWSFGSSPADASRSRIFATPRCVSGFFRPPLRDLSAES